MRQAENWTVWAKKADFQEIGKKYGIDQVTARIMRNRDIITDEEINNYLNGTMDMLPSPYLLKDVKKAAGILAEKIKSGKKICIIGDYDIDGVQSSYILWEGIENLGGNVYVTIPDRIKDGYGVNEQLVEAAIEEGADTILTCDNGIAAADALKKAEAEEARKVVLNAALEVIPYEAKDWCYRGRIYLELEQTDEAFSAFEESYNKGYAQAGYYLGYCYELQGKSEEAINLYQEQIKHDPQDAGLYNQLSSCLVRQGEYQDALIIIQKGMQLADESQMADFLWNESICYEKMGNYDTAIEKLMSYLEQYPADKDAKKELAFLYSR